MAKQNWKKMYEESHKGFKEIFDSKLKMGNDARRKIEDLEARCRTEHYFKLETMEELNRANRFKNMCNAFASYCKRENIKYHFCPNCGDMAFNSTFERTGGKLCPNCLKLLANPYLNEITQAE